MEHEIEGRCPRCPSIGTRMQNSNYVICDGKRYFFPYRLYHCQRHGIFVWQGNKHKAFDLSKRMSQVSKIEDLEPEVARRFEYMPTVTDYKIVEMQCPYCYSTWTQHLGFLIGNTETVLCPFCGVKLQKEKAKKDNR
jgi:ssDNA-binding Zn-finger/Zn-ribbon topoisomerase 1